ncbi:MAG: FkbM family methyltransferase [Bauldia sp.]|nr:FkbM family methyltransferase [Bauldia sp.]
MAEFGRRGILKLARVPFRPLRKAGRDARSFAVRLALGGRAGQRALNALDGVLPYRRRDTLRTEILAAFARDPALPAISRWPVRFAGKAIDLPLGPDIPLSLVLAIVGEDPNVKAEYAALLRHDRPALFLDVGANVGLHSVAMRVHGIETISFEPNESCLPQLRRIADAAGVAVRIEPVALGFDRGAVDLVYPRDRTVFGSIDTVVQAGLPARGEIVRQKAVVRRLDDYFAPGAGHVLLKIDTEGHELAVLQGATRFLTERRTTVIFESLPGHPTRRELFRLLRQHGYTIFRAGRRGELDERRFLAEQRTRNYIAHPPRPPSA